MSNDDNTPPPAPSGDPTPDQGIGGLAEPPSGTPVPPTEAFDAAGTPPPGVDATQMMPVVPTLPAATGTPPPFEPVIPLEASGAIPTTPTQALPPESWYRRPGAVAGILLGFLVVAAVIVFLVFAGGDDDADGVIEDIAPEAVSLVVTRLGSGGQPLNSALSATVVVQEPDAYTWVIPADAVVGQAGLRQTDGTGRVEFRWAPSDLADTATWTSTVEIAEFIAAEGEQAVTGLAFDCSLERDGSEEAIVGEANVRTDVNDPLATVGEYSFPNIRLIAGDRVDCVATNVVADAPPVIPESTTTIPESTTTIPESTTTIPETTTTSTTTTTTTSTTTSTTEVPPASPALSAYLAGQSDLTEAAALLDRVGLLSELEADDQPFTIFVPTNDAIQALRDSADAPDFNDDEVVRELFEAHIVRGAALDAAAIAAADEVAVSNGGPQPVDASTNPITVGGVDVTRTDGAVDGGIVHVIDGIFSFQP